jgi:sugar phosphate isomerase/epimerase
MDRRRFLGTVTAASLLTRRIAWAADDRKIQTIGLQLYTVRHLMKHDFEGTLAKVAEIGYREVEFAGYFDHPAKDIKAMLDRHGLAAPSAHVDYANLGDKWPQTLANAKVIGHSYIVCPSVPKNVSGSHAGGWKQAAQVFNRAGEASKAAGIEFAFHNHTEEFIPADGKLPYDLLLAETDPNLVKMEMDLFWITKAGFDPLAYFDRYPGRFPLVHVKGMDKKGNMSDVSADNSINWKKIFAQSDKAGIQHYFVEHDEPKSPLDDIRASFAYLQNLRF